MSQTYLVNGKHPISRLFVWYLRSVAISLAVFTLMALILWTIIGEPNHNILDGLPGFVSVAFGVWGMYTGAGAMVLWIVMWKYWARFERSSPSARIGWFMVLLVGMYYGGLIYALYVCMTGRIKSATSHEIAAGAQ